MLRLTKHRMSRIPNKLALSAALLLLVTAAIGIGNTPPDRMSAPELAVHLASDRALQQTQSIEPAKKEKRFKMSLYLFRFSR